MAPAGVYLEVSKNMEMVENLKIKNLEFYIYGDKDLAIVSAVLFSYFGGQGDAGEAAFLLYHYLVGAHKLFQKSQNFRFSIKLLPQFFLHELPVPVIK